MRVVTRPDFDGVVCAVLLFEVENVVKPVKWVEPDDIQKCLFDVQEGDIIANLPYDERCALWFDHHYANQIHKSFKGAFKLAPSAAGIIFEYYKDKFKRDYSELIKQTDKIDSADLSIDEIVHPEKYPYVLLSMTILGREQPDESHWNNLVDLLKKYEIKNVIEDPEVKKRCERVVGQNETYKTLLKQHTQLRDYVTITDFRSLDKSPIGNRFLSYALFPESVVNVKIRYNNDDREKIHISIGHSIINRNCNVNVGLMLSRFEGGGHRGAGACRFHVSKVDEYLPEIIDVLLKNKPNEKQDFS